MTKLKYLHLFVKFSILISIACQCFATKNYGTRLGELCNYRRICLDVNANCKGQVIYGNLLKRNEHTLKYRCECKYLYEEIEGKCQRSGIFSDSEIISIVTVIVLVIAISLILLLVTFYYRSDVVNLIKNCLRSDRIQFEEISSQNV